MSKMKTGLGKGLSALIRTPVQERPAPREEGRQQQAPGGIDHLMVSQIRPNPFQPRADFDQVALDELKASIREKGIIQPVTVRRRGDGVYELISGERRIRAASEIGLKTIPAYVIDVRTDEDMLELALIENLQREHLNPIEIAISYQRLASDVGLTPEQIASKVSKDRTTVVNFLRLLKLPEKIQQALRRGELSMGHARAIVSVSDEQAQLRLFAKIVSKGLNVRQVEQLVRLTDRKGARKSPPAGRRSDSAVENIEERVQQVLGTRVRVNVREGGSGDITVEFYSSDDLERIYDLLLSIKP